MTYQTIDLQEFKTRVIPVWEKQPDFNIGYTIVFHWKPIFQLRPFKNNKKNYLNDETMKKLKENDREQNMFTSNNLEEGFKFLWI